jgi:hypothetical protein
MCLQCWERRREFDAHPHHHLGHTVLPRLWQTTREVLKRMMLVKRLPRTGILDIRRGGRYSYCPKTTLAGLVPA